MINDKIGIKKQISTGDTLFDRYFSVYSSDKDQILKILSSDIKSDLLKWAEKEPVNNISDIRNYDNKFIFCVIGEIKNQYEFNELIKRPRRSLFGICHGTWHAVACSCAIW